MKTLLFCLVLLASGPALAAGTQYQLRVDGLACPFCSYGIEKKFMQTPGVESVKFDLEQGLVIVSVAKGIRLSEEQLDALIKDAGFTLRGVRELPPATAGGDTP